MAKIEPLGAADNANSIYDQAFTTALKNAGEGGTVMLPPAGGPFRVTRPIEVLERGVSIIGAGRHSQIVAQFSHSAIVGAKNGRAVIELCKEGSGTKLRDFHISTDKRMDKPELVPAHAILLRDQHEFEIRGVSVEGDEMPDPKDPAKKKTIKFPFDSYAFALESCFSGALYGCSVSRARGAFKIGRSSKGTHGSNNITVVTMISSDLPAWPKDRPGAAGLISGSNCVQLVGCELNVAGAKDGGGDEGSGETALSLEGFGSERAMAVNIIGGLYAATKEVIVAGAAGDMVQGLSISGAVITGLESMSARRGVHLQNVQGAVVQGNVLQHLNVATVYVDHVCAGISVGPNMALKKKTGDTDDMVVELAEAGSDHIKSARIYTRG